MSPNQVSRYETVLALGNPGEDRVFKAIDPANGNVVTIRKFQVTGEALRDGLEAAQQAAMLDSPNIIQVQEVGEADNGFYMVSEFVHGKTLSTLLAKNEEISFWEISDIGRQVGSALDHARARHLVHRNLTPANIMVELDGTVKVMDYGVLTDPRESYESGRNRAALCYLSPEQAKGGAPDWRSNIFSLGTILYELVTGQKAFPGTEARTILDSILSKDPLPPHEVKRTVNPGVSRVIMKALAKAPDERYQSAAEFIHEFENSRKPSAAPVPVSAPPSSVQKQEAPPRISPVVNVSAPVRPPVAPVKQQPPIPAANVRPQNFAPRQPVLSVNQPTAPVTRPPTADQPIPAMSFRSQSLDTLNIPNAVSPMHPASPANHAIPMNPADPGRAANPVPPQIPVRSVEPPRPAISVAMAPGELTPLSEPAAARPNFIKPVSPQKFISPKPRPVTEGSAKQTALKPRKPSLQETVTQITSPVAALLSSVLPKERKLWMKLALGVPFLVASFAIGYAMHSHNQQPAPQPAPPPAEVAQAPAPTPVEPAVEETPSSPSPVDKTKLRPDRRSKRQKYAPVASAALLPVTGGLIIDSSPQGATVQVDGQNTTLVTPCTASGLSAGQHTIALSKPGFATEARRVEIAAGQKSFLSIPLGELKATVLISSDPAGAMILIDGQATGKTTPVSVLLKRGSYNVSVQKEGYLRASTQIEAVPGQSLRFAPRLMAMGNADGIKTVSKLGRMLGRHASGDLATLQIRTNPKGARITINQRQLDKTTPAEFAVPAGSYEVVIALDGYRPFRRTITLLTGATFVIDENLPK